MQPALPLDVAQRAHQPVMGGEQATSVLATVKRDGIELRGGSWSTPEEKEKPSRPHPPAVRGSRATYATAACGTTASSTADTRRVLALQR